MDTPGEEYYFVPLFIATPEDVIDKKTALSVGSALHRDEKYCWR
jgi:hypothetical protein